MEWLAGKLLVGGISLILSAQPRPVLKARKPYKIVYMIKES